MSFCRAAASLSWSCAVFGSIATEMTGSGNVIVSRTMGESGSHSVSPVKVCFSPTAATMSPENTASMSSRWFACIWRMRPMRSLRSRVAFCTCDPAVNVPE